MTCNDNQERQVTMQPFIICKTFAFCRLLAIFYLEFQFWFLKTRIA